MDWLTADILRIYLSYEGVTVINKLEELRQICQSDLQRALIDASIKTYKEKNGLK